jgi:Fingers domain of DNA polymerase lambda
LTSWIGSAYRYKIRTVAEVEELPFIGPKAKLKVCAISVASPVGFELLTVNPLPEISQYLSCGMIEETQTLANNPYYKTLSLFTTLYGIGPHTAQELYAMGMRSMEDLEVYYTKELKTTKNTAHIEGMLHSLALRDEFNVK